MVFLWISLAIFLGIVIGISIAIAGAKNLLDDILHVDSMQLSDRTVRRINKRYERDKRKGLHDAW